MTSGRAGFAQLRASPSAKPPLSGTNGIMANSNVVPDRISNNTCSDDACASASTTQVAPSTSTSSSSLSAEREALEQELLQLEARLSTDASMKLTANSRLIRLLAPDPLAIVPHCALQVLELRERKFQSWIDVAQLIPPPEPSSPLLEQNDLALFGQAPLKDSIALVECNYCKRTISASALVVHLTRCSSASQVPGLRSEACFLVDPPKPKPLYRLGQRMASIDEYPLATCKLHTIRRFKTKFIPVEGEYYLARLARRRAFMRDMFISENPTPRQQIPRYMYTELRARVTNQKSMFQRTQSAQPSRQHGLPSQQAQKQHQAMVIPAIAAGSTSVKPSKSKKSKKGLDNTRPPTIADIVANGRPQVPAATASGPPQSHKKATMQSIEATAATTPSRMPSSLNQGTLSEEEKRLAEQRVRQLMEMQQKRAGSGMTYQQQQQYHVEQMRAHLFQQQLQSPPVQANVSMKRVAASTPRATTPQKRSRSSSVSPAFATTSQAQQAPTSAQFEQRTQQLVQAQSSPSVHHTQPAFLSQQQQRQQYLQATMRQQGPQGVLPLQQMQQLAAVSTAGVSRRHPQQAVEISSSVRPQQLAGQANQGLFRQHYGGTSNSDTPTHTNAVLPSRTNPVESIPNNEHQRRIDAVAAQRLEQLFNSSDLSNI